MKRMTFRLIMMGIIGAMLVFSSCDNDSLDLGIPSLERTTIWSGPTVTFQKADGDDPNLPENQDQLSNSVALTRGNNGGQIYNAVSETNSDKDNSPLGTLWARGTTADLQNLSFGAFRATVDKPKDAVGLDLVLLLVEENIAIDIKFTSWGQNRQGSFSYERSSE